MRKSMLVSLEPGSFGPSASYIRASLLCAWYGRALTFECGLSRGFRVHQTSATEQRQFVATVAAAPVYDIIWPPSTRRESTVLISEHMSSHHALCAIWSNIDLSRALHRRSGSLTVALGLRRSEGSNSTSYLFRLACKSTWLNQPIFEEISSIK